MKDTLHFYSDIYETLAKKQYGRNNHKVLVPSRFLVKFLKQHNIKIKTMIDVGCRWGKALKYLNNEYYKTVGIDVSEEMVSCCYEKGLKCYLASATDLSIFKDKTFDLYMATDVYEHLRTEDLQDAIQEAKRITKKYLFIKPGLRFDRKHKLHLTLWSLKQWHNFFIRNQLKLIKIGKNDKMTYKNMFLMKIKKSQ